MVTPENPETRALAFLDTKDFDAAASEYMHLAENSKIPEQYMLKAIDAYIKGNRFSQATGTIDKLNTDRLSPEQKVHLSILLALIALANQDFQTAFRELSIQVPVNAPHSLLASFYSARAQAFQLNHQIMNAIRARLELGQYLVTQDELTINKLVTWDLLSGLSVIEVEKETVLSTDNLNLGGWLELALISKTSKYNLQNLQVAIASWQEKYPGHPALGEIIDNIFSQAEQINIQPAQIALILPFNNQYREVSSAIREGFLSAWYVSAGKKPVIRIYNSDRQNIIEIYKSAVNDGAEFIVGPLEKEAITTLVDSNAITVNTLVLNQINSEIRGNLELTGGVVPSLFQFGLLPEDEAYQTAEYAWFNGHANALVITPDTLWGDRIFNAFSTHWAELGGKIIEHVKISANTEDYASPIKQLLNIDNSEARAKQLIVTLNRKIYSEPRHRQDADLVFLAATPVIARQLIPQLRFFRADDITTYSISSIHTGIFNPAANSDIDNVIFSDMPWILDPEFEYSPLQQTLNKTWEQDESPYRRLYAFGIDAYQLIPELGKLYSQNDTYKGFTGNLKVNNLGYINRTTVWAKFVNGSPKLLH